MPICYIVTALPCTNVLPTDLCMCFIRVQAYQRGVMYPQFIFLHPAWWVGNWWKGGDMENFTCTVDQRERVVYRSIAVLLYEYIENNNTVAQTGTVSYFISVSYLLYKFWKQFSSFWLLATHFISIQLHCWWMNSSIGGCKHLCTSLLSHAHLMDSWKRSFLQCASAWLWDMGHPINMKEKMRLFPDWHCELLIPFSSYLLEIPTLP